jgi:hypothetical protein
MRPGCRGRAAKPRRSRRRSRPRRQATSPTCSRVLARVGNAAGRPQAQGGRHRPTASRRSQIRRGSAFSAGPLRGPVLQWHPLSAGHRFARANPLRRPQAPGSSPPERGECASRRTTNREAMAGACDTGAPTAARRRGRDGSWKWDTDGASRCHPFSTPLSSSWRATWSRTSPSPPSFSTPMECSPSSTRARQIGPLSQDEWRSELSHEGHGRQTPWNTESISVALREGRPAHERFHLQCRDEKRIEVEASILPLAGQQGMCGGLLAFWPVEDGETR